MRSVSHPCTQEAYDAGCTCGLKYLTSRNVVVVDKDCPLHGDEHRWRAAAKRVCDYDWPDCDPVAVAVIKRLRQLL